MINRIILAGMARKKAIALAALFAAFCIFFVVERWLSSMLSSWISAKTVSGLYSLLDLALWLVIIGVIFEEWELFWKGLKLTALLRRGLYKEAFLKTKAHSKEAVTAFGFMILVFGLASELALQPVIEAKQEFEQSGLRGKAIEAFTRAEAASKDAAVANMKAKDLLNENIELERALAPRTINEAAVANALNDLPRVPLYFSSAPSEEARETAKYLAASFVLGLSKPPWSVQFFASNISVYESIEIEYPNEFNEETKSFDRLPSAGKQVAMALCKNLKSQGISARTRQDRPGGAFWPKEIPASSVVVNVGPKPNRFWLNKMLREKGRDALPETDFCDSEDAIKAFMPLASPAPKP